jgi:excisionase family DNA binding protein
MARQQETGVDERLLTLRAASERLGLSDWTLRKWALQGRIDSVRLGGRRLIPERVVNDLIARNLQKADCRPELRLT